MQNQVYQTRRGQISHKLSEHDMLLIFSAKKVHRNNDVHYPFYQDSNFYYLTGWSEANTALMLTKDEAILFCQQPNEFIKIWEGELLSLQAITNTTGLRTEDIEQLQQFLKKHPVKNIYSNQLDADELVAFEAKDANALIASMRVVKDAFEIECIKSAIDISIQGHKLLMREAKHGMTENALYGTWLQNLHAANLKHEAYPAIIAAGMNACTLHYTKLASPGHDSELLLVDAGVEYKHYASDLTRTFPINAKFSAMQADVYNQVLEIQDLAVKYCQYGVSMAELNEYVSGLYHKSLIALGVDPVVRKYAPHSIGHALGLDVHDVGLTKDMAIPCSAVITIEPGLYFRDTKYAGIGVRIEDNYLMTKDGLVCLSAGLPKSVADIEDLCG